MTLSKGDVKKLRGRIDRGRTEAKQEPRYLKIFPPICRALARTRFRICTEIEDLMRRIIQQGETVKAHLLMIQVYRLLQLIAKDRR